MQNTAHPTANKSKGRSRITNNRALFPRTIDGQSIDGRGMWSRRLRDLIARYSSDAGGDNAISEGERSIIRRIATLQCALERMEAQFALDEGDATPGQLDQYQRLANSQRRLIETMGLRRRARDVTPDLQDYLASRSRRGTARVTLDHEELG